MAENTSLVTSSGMIQLDLRLFEIKISAAYLAKCLCNLYLKKEDGS